MLNKNLVIIGSAAASGAAASGIPEDVRTVGVQFVGAVIAWLGTVALDWISKKLQSGKKSKNSKL